MKMSDKMYNILKFIVQHIFPAIAAFYFVLSSSANLPYCEEVLGSIAAIETALGAYLGISTSKYNKTKDGTFEIDTSDPETDNYRLKIDVPLESLVNKTSLNLKIDANANLSQEKQTI